MNDQRISDGDVRQVVKRQTVDTTDAIKPPPIDRQPRPTAVHRLPVLAAVARREEPVPDLLIASVYQ
jgi:hypothetical protein